MFDTSSDMMWTVANVLIDTKSNFFNNLVLTSLFSLVPGLGFSLEEENFVGYSFLPPFFFGVFETHSWALVAHPRQLSVSSRPSWSIKRVPGQQEVHRETKNKQQKIKIEILVVQTDQELYSLVCAMAPVLLEVYSFLCFTLCHFDGVPRKFICRHSYSQLLRKTCLSVQY